MRRMLLIGATGLLALCTQVQAGVVGFDEYDCGGGVLPLPANAFAAEGVIADRAIPIAFVEALDPLNYNLFENHGGSNPNGLVLNSQWGTSISFSFVGPETNSPATTNFFTVLCYDTNIGTVAGTLTAFAADGSILATSSKTTPIGGLVTLTVNAAGIAKVTLSSDNDGSVFDNLSFNTPLVPAPGAVALLAVAGLVAGRRRR